MPPVHRVCIHAHFYQPPRENPWTGTVPSQASAAPAHDWNTRIARECYGPNTDARILDAKGRIREIVNNYASISFNFGPTLLDWIEEHRPEIHQAILDADRESLVRFGRGSAMAQAYNHMILPLADARDRLTQVRWGIADFQRRFGRKPEGMWLPECAVDTPTLADLAREGIAFVVLAPHQADAVRPLGMREWRKVDERTLETGRAYRIVLPGGRTISAFFYQGAVARDVAFNGLLNDGDRLAQRLIDSAAGESRMTRLVHFATDGESYGHHHRFGEMALAWAIRLLQESEQVRITNYASWLEGHPPEWEARIVENSSWSCAHGVERWRSDCGCHTGGGAGWNQSWRGPLRSAFDWLRDTLRPRFERMVAEWLRDPWEARDAYIELLVPDAAGKMDAWLDRHARKPLDGAARSQVLRLMDLQRNAMLMYTSCGWFFDDPAGLETVQCLRYAERAVEEAGVLFEDFPTEEWISRLHAIRSNKAEEGDAVDLIRRQVWPGRMRPVEAAGREALARLFDLIPPDTVRYAYDVKWSELHHGRRDGTRLWTGEMQTEERRTRAHRAFLVAAWHLGGGNLGAWVVPHELIEDANALQEQVLRAFNAGEAPAAPNGESLGMRYDLMSLYRDERRVLIERILADALEQAEAEMEALHRKVQPLDRFIAEAHVPLPPIYQTASGHVLTRAMVQSLEWRRYAEFWTHREEAARLGVVPDMRRLAGPLQSSLREATRLLSQRPADAEWLDRLLSLLLLVEDEWQDGIDLRPLQDEAWRMLSRVKPELWPDPLVKAWAEIARRLGLAWPAKESQ